MFDLRSRKVVENKNAEKMEGKNVNCVCETNRSNHATCIQQTTATELKTKRRKNKNDNENPFFFLSFLLHQSDDLNVYISFIFHFHWSQFFTSNCRKEMTACVLLTQRMQIKFIHYFGESRRCGGNKKQFQNPFVSAFI